MMVENSCGVFDRECVGVFAGRLQRDDCGWCLMMEKQEKIGKRLELKDRGLKYSCSGRGASWKVGMHMKWTAWCSAGRHHENIRSDMLEVTCSRRHVQSDVFSRSDTWATHTVPYRLSARWEILHARKVNSALFTKYHWHIRGDDSQGSSLRPQTPSPTHAHSDRLTSSQEQVGVLEGKAAQAFLADEECNFRSKKKKKKKKKKREKSKKSKQERYFRI